MKKLDIFIEGELVNLCIPTAEFANGSEWYAWFNSKIITKYLNQGVFPNTPEKQLEFFNSQQDSRLTLIISNKKKYMGVVSLSSIDLIEKSCEIALVMNNKVHTKMAPYISIEAMALITEHAFTMLGVNRIVFGQHLGLRGFQQRLELLGYKIEGLHHNKFIKGREVSDSILVACLYKDFQNIVHKRGSLWDTLSLMKARFQKLPKKAFVDLLSEFHDNERNDYYKKIFEL